jgi:hypothetical protein
METSFGYISCTGAASCEFWYVVFAKPVGRSLHRLVVDLRKAAAAGGSRT